MKKYLIYIICFLSYSLMQGQKQGNVWHFGVGAGLNFNNGTAQIITGGQTGTDITNGNPQEGTASISDSSGALLFYTGGKTIWNRFHQAMPNGSNIMGGPSSTQSSIIIPKPGNDTLFYVFTSGEFQDLPNNSAYRYSIVNLCLDGGKGDVLANQKNILLTDSSTEKLSVCRDAAGTGYWIMGHKMYSKKFYAWHLTAAGITATVVSNLGTLHGWSAASSSFNVGHAIGQMKFNPAGTKLAVAIGNNFTSILDLFDFNNSTGNVSSFCHMNLDSANHKFIYGIEFSPSGSLLYASLTGGNGGTRLYQLDLNAGGGNCNAVRSSSLAVFQSSANPILNGLQVGPDNKIYGVTANAISCINAPDLPGIACNFVLNAIPLQSPASNAYTLPAFIAGYKYINKLNPCCTNPSLTVNSSGIVCAGNSVTLTSGGAVSYSWSTGASGSVTTVNPLSPTVYTVTGFSAGGCFTKKVIAVNVNPIPIISVNGNNTVCLGSSVIQTAGGANSYTWNTGSNSNTISITPLVNTVYTVTGTDLNGCVNSSTVLVNVLTLSQITGFSYPSTICNNSSDPLPSTIPGFISGGTFSSNGLNLDPLTGQIDLYLSPPGNYSVTYSLPATTCASASSSTAAVTIIPSVTLSISSNTAILEGASTTLTVSGGVAYAWSPSTNLSCSNCDAPIATPFDDTEYCVSSELNGCVSKACVMISVGCDNSNDLSVPNAFTPNNDGHNDAFCLQGWMDCITNFNVMIFDRWGEKVYESNDPSFCWDGIYKGQLMNAGVFVYVIKAAKKKEQISKKGNITLIR